METFSLQPGVQLPPTFTSNPRPEPDVNLAAITYGGEDGRTPVEMDLSEHLRSA
jgi:hypothetical protein